MAGVLGGVGAGLFLVASISVGYDAYALRERGVQTAGLVVDEVDGSGRSSSVLTVRYETESGAVVEAETSDYVDHDPDVEPGGTIEVVYDPQRPEVFQDVRWGTGYLVPAGLASGAVLVGALTVREVRRARREG